MLLSAYKILLLAGKSEIPRGVLIISRGRDRRRDSVGMRCVYHICHEFVTGLFISCVAKYTLNSIRLAFEVIITFLVFRIMDIFFFECCKRWLLKII